MKLKSNNNIVKKFYVAVVLCLLVGVTFSGVMSTGRIKEPSGSTAGYWSGGVQYIMNTDTGETWVSSVSNLVTAVNMSGVKICIPSDTYILSTGPLFLANNTEIVGAGVDKTIIKCIDNFGYDMIRFPGADNDGVFHKNITIRDLTIDASGQTGANAGILFDEVENFTLTNVKIMHTSLDGVKCMECKNGSIDQIKTFDTGNHAIFLGYNSDFIAVSNIVSRISGTEHVCIEWTRDNDFNENITVCNVVGDEANNSGVYVQHAKNVQISNIVCHNSKNAHYFVKGPASNIEFNGVIGSGHKGSYDWAFKFETGCQDIKITGGTFNFTIPYNDDSYSCSFALAYDVTVDGVTFNNCKFPTFVNTGAKNITFKDCEFKGSATKMYVRKASNVSFVNCDFGKPNSSGLSNLFYVFDDAINWIFMDNDMRITTSGDKLQTESASSLNDVYFRCNIGLDEFTFPVGEPDTKVNGTAWIEPTNYSIVSYDGTNTYYYEHT